MPKFEFECPYCNLHFERTLKQGEHPTHDCPKCGSDAPRIWDGFAFGFADKPGAVPGNTGVHDKDYPTADKAVGRSAESRWEQYHERDKVKKAVRKEGKTPAIARRHGPGFVEYEAMSKPGLDANKKLREAVVEVRKNEAQ